MPRSLSECVADILWWRMNDTNSPLSFLLYDAHIASQMALWLTYFNAIYGDIIMKKSTKVISVGIIGITIAVAAITAYAGKSHCRWGGGCDKPSFEQASQAQIDIDKAMNIALADVPDQVIEVEMEMEQDALVWEIEVLNKDNQVYELEIDANDGRILEKEKEHSRD